MHSKYFEGILQLRNPSLEVNDFIEKNIIKNEQVITEVKKLKNGVDLYFQRKKFMSSLATKVLKEFGGKLKKSATLHTRDSQTSKNLYRLTILLSFPDFIKQDVLVIDDVVYLVTHLATKLSLLNLTTGKKTKKNYSDKYEKLIKKKTMIISKNPLQVLNPEDYQPINLINTVNKIISLNEEVTIVLFKGFAYLV